MVDGYAGSPRISVVMPAYNAAKFVSGAIESILRQSYGNFEFIIIDDGSIDETPAIIASYSDRRIRAVRNETNLGLINSLNKGLDMARGEFIARMDADDESLPTRFAEQVRFLDAHPNIGLCGTAVETFGARCERWAMQFDPALVRCQLLFDSGVVHSCAMFRRSLVVQHNLQYELAYPHAEDYALWTRFASVAEIANLSTVLLKVRLHPQSVGQTNRGIQQRTADSIRREQLKRLGLEPTPRQLIIQRTLMRGAPHTLALDVKETESWLLTLMEANRQSGYCDPAALSLILYDMWFRLCRTHRHALKSATRRFVSSHIARCLPWPSRFADGARLLISS